MSLNTGDYEPIKKSKVFAIIDPEIKNEIDLRFLPSETRFITDPPDASLVIPPRRLILASKNTDSLASITSEWLRQDDSVIEILWNPIKSPDLAYTLKNLSQEAPLLNFRVANNTAHLVLAHISSMSFHPLPTALVPEVVELLEETLEENVMLPPDLFKQLVWRHSYLLNHLDELNEKNQRLAHQLSTSRAADQAIERAKLAEVDAEKKTEINSQLNQKITELEIKVKLLEKQYYALSNSKLGSLTLKYWEKRRK